MKYKDVFDLLNKGLCQVVIKRQCQAATKGKKQGER